MIQLSDVLANLLAPVIALVATALGAFLTTRSAGREQESRRATFDSLAKALKVSRPESQDGPLENKDLQSRWRPAGLDETSPPGSGDSDDESDPPDAAEREIALYLKYQQGSLSQSNSSFWISFGVGIIGFAIILAGVLLVIFGGAEEGAVTAVSGVVPTAAGSLLYARADASAKRADEKFEKLATTVRQAGATRRATNVAALIGDATVKDRALSVLCLQQVFPDAAVKDLGDALRSTSSDSSEA